MVKEEGEGAGSEEASHVGVLLSFFFRGERVKGETTTVRIDDEKTLSLCFLFLSRERKETRWLPALAPTSTSPSARHPPRASSSSSGPTSRRGRAPTSWRSAQASGGGTRTRMRRQRHRGTRCGFRGRRSTESSQGEIFQIEEMPQSAKLREKGRQRERNRKREGKAMLLFSDGGDDDGRKRRKTHHRLLRRLRLPPTPPPPFFH